MDYNDARLVTDIAGLDQLKAKARENPSAALGEVADQFESLLVGIMVKSMRQASLGDGLLDSRQSLMYRDMLDQQLAVHLADKGMGLAEEIERQLGGNAGGEGLPGRDTAAYLAARVPQAASVTASDPVRSSRSDEPALDTPAHFVEHLMPWAREAAAELGMAPEALLAQAALETGWGRSVIHGSSGNSHNLFGIKADTRWEGERASVSTLEYVDGVAVRRKDPFRAYGSYRESFQDYVEFLRNNSRYRDALAQAGDARAYFDALQSAGYATDPAYADKVLRVLSGREMGAALERLELQAEARQTDVATDPARG